jgi:SNF family Na+-dependent transporter
MRKKGIVFTLTAMHFAVSLVGAMLFALCFSADAKQAKKGPGISYLRGHY